VLLNFRKHLRAAPGVDPRSSGAWFDGWTHERTPPAEAPAVRPPQTWLGSRGWRRAGGPLDVRERPAANSAKSRSGGAEVRAPSHGGGRGTRPRAAESPQIAREGRALT
jgi:hypothetical protein